MSVPSQAAGGGQRFPWRRMAISYGWSILVRELEASSRWSPETKARAVVGVGVVISLPVTLGTAVPYVYWLLTGQGPWRRYGLSSSVVAHPFPRGMSPEMREAFATMAQTACETRPGSRCQQPGPGGP